MLNCKALDQNSDQRRFRASLPASCSTCGTSCRWAAACGQASGRCCRTLRCSGSGQRCQSGHAGSRCRSHTWKKVASYLLLPKMFRIMQGHPETYHSGRVMTESTTVPGGGLVTFPVTRLNNLQLMRFFTTTTVSLGLWPTEGEAPSENWPFLV